MCKNPILNKPKKDYSRKSIEDPGNAAGRSEEALVRAMDKYARWLDDQIAKSVAGSEQAVDQAGI